MISGGRNCKVSNMAIRRVLFMAVVLLAGCVSVPKQHGVTEPRSQSPGSSLSESSGDDLTLAGVAVKNDRDAVSTKDERDTQTGKANLKLEKDITAAGDVTTDSWTSIILALALFGIASGPFAIAIYVLTHRWEWVRNLVDGMKGKNKKKDDETSEGV